MRLLTAANLGWVVRHRAWTPYYLKRYWRFAWFKLRHPQVVTEGAVRPTDRPGTGLRFDRQALERFAGG